MIKAFLISFPNTVRIGMLWRSGSSLAMRPVGLDPLLFERLLCLETLSNARVLLGLGDAAG